MARYNPFIETIADYNHEGKPLTLRSKDLYGSREIHDSAIEHYPALYLVVSPTWKDRIEGGRFDPGLKGIILQRLEAAKCDARVSGPFTMKEWNGKSILRVHFLKNAMSAAEFHSLIKDLRYESRRIISEHPPAPYSQYETLLDKAATSERPSQILFEGLFGPHGIVNTTYETAADQVAKIAGTTAVAVDHMRFEKVNLPESAANAMLQVGNVPEPLRERYRDMLTGIPDPRRILQAVIDGNSDIFSEVHLKMRRDKKAFEKAKTSIGKVALLYKFRKSLSRNDFGISHTVVSGFESGKQFLRDDTAAEYAKSMQLEGEEKRAFILLAKGQSYLDHEAILNLENQDPPLSNTEYLKTLIEQSALYPRRHRKWGYESEREMFNLLDNGLKFPGRCAEDLAGAIGFDDELAGKFKTSFINKFTHRRESVKPLTIIEKMQRSECTFLQGLRALIDVTGVSHEVFCTKVGIKKEMLHRPRLARMAVMQTIIAELATGLAKVDHELDTSKFTEDMQALAQREDQRLGEGHRPYKEHGPRKKGNTR